MAQMLTLPAMINTRNRAFWEAESAQAERRMADSDVFHRATVDMNGEAARLLPLYYRKSFEQALRDADRAVQRSQLNSQLRSASAPARAAAYRS